MESQLLHISPEQAKPLQNGVVSKFENLEDHIVWNEFRKENEAAFLFIYNKYFDILFSYGFQFSHDRDFIKDCIQDLFVELNSNRKKLSPVHNIKAYLLKSIKRKILYYQKRSKKFIYKNDLLEGYDFRLSFSYEDKLINQQIEQEKVQKLNKAIDTVLTRRQKEVIYYLYHEKLSVDEIVDLMKINKRGVQNLVYKTIGILKGYLTGLLITLFC